MQFNQMTPRLALAATLLTAPLAYADNSPWYLGADVGQSSFALKLPSPYSTNTPEASEDRNSTAYALSGGYRFNHYVAFEAGYMNLGKYKLHYQSNSQTGNASARVDGLSASALWQLPLNDQWALFLKTGALFARGKADASVTGGSGTETFSRNENAVVPILGVGVSYAVSSQWGLRLQYQDIGAASVAKAAGYKVSLHDDVWSLGLTYGF